MNQEQLNSTFDAQAESYDQLWSKLSSFRDALHILVASVFGALPADSRILCVGPGTGAEVHDLADRFPGWTFTAVEPSAGMLNVFRARAEKHGFADRCTFHEGYVDSLRPSASFDAATCFLVSQFILQPQERSLFFRSIAHRLKPGGILASSDLAADVSSETYQSLLDVWFRTMSGADVPAEGVQRMRDAYARDVAILPPATVESIIKAGGFESPVQFFQVGLIHAWYSKRSR